MGFLDLLLHLSGFVAPALALALLMPTASRWLLRLQPVRAMRWWVQAGIGFAVGVVVLLGGLWVFGRDGKMATYAALVGVMATLQWLMAGGWRR
ncbi:hypothetical protein JI739_21045 [Ramlibacter sp. AW1]|uniref:Uncharacterized protein n=1 Tax=Ramlibacter aurantiacus TaxID=2801330 RepID=A0A936ZSF6_9BURK|nr:hypothetical protein [Ramlibacter aurantiacus]MBL0422836.1 hypothetical protein [Ramlibacter aurantiacus]